ncbi:AraC family transcriptional regulator [Bordetella genomosp. 1]|nr:helix-turn-helix transcriptional regulator [Bordetella genomosp. 1]
MKIDIPLSHLAAEDCRALEQSLHAAPMGAVTGVAVAYPPGHRVPAHQHDYSQLLYAAEGLMHVEASTGRWVVPPTTAVWIGPNVAHGFTVQRSARVYGIFVAPGLEPDLSINNGVIQVSALLRALILRVAQAGPGIGASRHGQLMSALLLEELSTRDALPFFLPWPKDARLAKVCDALSAEPGQSLGLDDWAATLAMSGKTLHRHFVQDTGMTFGRWRQRLRLLRALDALLEGEPILQVALQCGYQSHSAFTLAFRQHFGMAPSVFARQGQAALEAEPAA